MNYTEFTGKTVDEAIENGLKELGLTAEQADIRVLEEGKKKLFGSVKARVEIAAKEVEKEVAKEVVKGIVKEFGEKGIMFSVPVTFWEGIE